MIKTTTLLLLFAYFTPVSVFGQLSSEYNRIRIGDNIVKQQVEYKDPGKSGRNRLWNFSKLKTTDYEYTISYSRPPLQGDSIYIMGDTSIRKNDVKYDELIVGTEHNTMYYYQVRNDTLFQLGYENPSNKVGYTQPMTIMNFPLNYGQEKKSHYITKGLYSGSMDIKTEGTAKTEADAYGKIILPSGDTLSPVLRIKTLQLINNLQDNDYKQVETYRWYSKGYRYPIFETIRNINLPDSSVVFTTSFFYPPQEHYYLETEFANQDSIDKLWDMSLYNLKEELYKEQTNELSCNIYPNPIESLLTIEYILNKAAAVNIYLYGIDGKVYKQVFREKQTDDIYIETIDCTDLRAGNYLLKIIAEDKIKNVKIIKK